MVHRLEYGIVRETPRRVIHVVRVRGAILDVPQIEAIAERMRERLAFRGEVVAEVVMVQGAGKETLRLTGEPYSVSRVRAAMFNAAVRWSPLELG
jgi:hypothetical protein